MYKNLNFSSQFDNQPTLSFCMSRMRQWRSLDGVKCSNRILKTENPTKFLIHNGKGSSALQNGLSNHFSQNHPSFLLLSSLCSTQQCMLQLHDPSVHSLPTLAHHRQYGPNIRVTTLMLYAQRRLSPQCLSADVIWCYGNFWCYRNNKFFSKHAINCILCASAKFKKYTKISFRQADTTVEVRSLSVQGIAVCTRTDFVYQAEKWEFCDVLKNCVH